MIEPNLPDLSVGKQCALLSISRSSFYYDPKGEETVSELASRFGVHPTMIHQCKRALLEGASGVFERGGRKAPEVDEEQVKDLHAKIGELAVANDFLARKLKPWTGK